MNFISGMNTYAEAMQNFSKTENSLRQKTVANNNVMPTTSFADTLKTSLNEVNDLQSQKNQMIESFASGETQNVHELMITLQKASVAVNMTSAVRNKVLESYRELTRIQF